MSSQKTTPASRPLRVAIIGCGGIAKEHMRGYQSVPGVEVVACSDLDGERARTFAALPEYAIPRSYNDYREMLANEKLDGVSVCTPNAAHCEPTVSALEAGVSVLVEKPIAMSVVEAQLMTDTARRKGVLLSVGHHMRFLPQVRHLKARIDAGDLGEIYYGRSHALRRRGIPGWGAFHIKARSGGGPLADIGVHTLDMILYLMGSPQPVSVTGQVYRKFGDRPDFFPSWGAYKLDEFDVEDFACGFVRFDNGATLALEASWAAHLPEQDSYDQLVLGDRGGALVTPQPAPGHPALRLFASHGEALLDTSVNLAEEKSPHTRELQHWIKCLRGEAEVLVKPEECLNVQRIIDGVYQSAEEGREVVVAPSA